MWTLEVQFICTDTGSRTLRQVVNKGHRFVLTTDKRKTKDFFFISSAVPPNSTFLLSVAEAHVSHSSKAWERLCDFIISAQTGKKTWKKCKKLPEADLKGQDDGQKEPTGSYDDQNDWISTVIIICTINSLLTYSGTQGKVTSSKKLPPLSS